MPVKKASKYVKKIYDRIGKRISKGNIPIIAACLPLSAYVFSIYDRGNSSVWSLERLIFRY